MITIPWWVLPLAIAGGIGFCALMVTIWIGRIDSLVNTRVDARLEPLVALLTGPTVEPAPGLMPPVDPWSYESREYLLCGLREPVAPELPEHTWWGTRTGSLPIVPLAEPEAAEVAEVVKGKTKSNPRKRFSEPKPPKEITVAAVAGDEVRSEKTSVKA